MNSLEAPAEAASPITETLRCPEPLAQGKPDSLAQNQQHATRIQQLLEQVEAVADPAARAIAHECIQGLLAFYGDGLAQIIRIAQNSSPGLIDVLAGDQLVSALLLIHGLHPVDLETRLCQALNKVRPYMESHGGSVELVSLLDGVAKLRLEGTCKTCPSSTVTLELAVRRAVEEACPDLLGFEVDGVIPQNSNMVR